MKILSVYALLPACVSGASDASPTVVLPVGTVVGTTTIPTEGHVVEKFLGIPFAQAPVGNLRFRRPQPLEEFTENPLLATEWGPICVQQGIQTEEEIARTNEDCLTLNVFAPSVKSKRPLPVLVWIHGGALNNGYSSRDSFDGSGFVSSHGIVVVTINYRVNVFGFPNSPDITVEDTNVGFYDQRMALDWIQEHIGAFGGDPRQVTIGGESSGASSVDRLVATHLVGAPFRAAIQMSGQASVSAFNRSGGPESWQYLVEATGCGSRRAQLVCMQEVDVMVIHSLINDPSAAVSFPPVNDGITQLEIPLIEENEAGTLGGVPLLVGSTAKEGNYLIYQYGLDPDTSTFSWEQLREFLYAASGGDAATIASGMALVSEVQSATGLGLWDATSLVYTELNYQCPARLVSHATSSNSIPTWRYIYNASFPNLAWPGYPDLGPTHVSDISMFWGTYPREGATGFQTALSKVMHGAFADFIHDPFSRGPGWPKVGDSAAGVACLGCHGSEDPVMVNEEALDVRCSLYDDTYETVHVAGY